MCGIVALYSSDSPTEHNEGLFRKAMVRIRHRGLSYDELGSVAPNCLLGCNRLEIVDRGNGRQPFVSNDGTVGVVHNGEIYNHEELQKELLGSGYRFRSFCDTEVILAGYLTWGMQDLCARIRGMFAFVIHDARTNELHAVRDPFGIKPLCWIEDDGITLLASEAKALFHVGMPVRELGPGEALRLQPGAPASVKRYANPAAVRPDPAGPGFDEAKNNLCHLVSRAVERRVRTDLPVAVFLGGIDSAVILSQAIKYHDDVTAFCIGRENAQDVVFARSLCKDLGVTLRVIQVDVDELLCHVPDTVRCIESFEPNHIRGGTLSFLLARQVRDAGYRVALCGEGADELFGGYAEYGYALRREGYGALSSLRQRFVGELYKTQLKRVDRTAMAFTLEVRVPFLDMDVADFAMRLPPEFLLVRQNGNVLAKHILREAFRPELKNYVVDQEKRVLSAGAGFGTNAEEGPFFKYANLELSQEEFVEMKARYPELRLRNREEALYLRIFSRYYPVKLSPFLLPRPYVNRTEIAHE